MPNSNGRALFGRSNGTVTVIEEPVRRSTARNAKIAACVTWVVVTVLSAVVLASRWHPVIALFAGALIGLPVAVLVAGAVLIWPVARVIWWWLPEIWLVTALVAIWVWLADRLTLPYLLGAVLLIAGIPAAIPLVRRRLVALAWCFVTRHRIRTCFSEFIVYNRTGSLPLVLWCIPTPVGERLWLFLRPGLTLEAIQSRVSQIAVTCWADTAIAVAASPSNSAYIRIDIKRRDALTGTVVSPLLGHVIPGAPAKDRDPGQAPTALDLPDVSPAEVTPDKPASRADKNTPPVVSAVPAAAGDDVSDWL